jgi:hypothetical protein
VLSSNRIDRFRHHQVFFMPVTALLSRPLLIYFTK